MMVFNRNRSQAFSSKCGPSAMSTSPRSSSSSRYHEVNKKEVSRNQSVVPVRCRRLQDQQVSIIHEQLFQNTDAKPALARGKGLRSVFWKLAYDRITALQIQ